MHEITASQPPRTSELSAISRDRIATIVPPATTQNHVLPEPAAGGEHRSDRRQDQTGDPPARRG